MSILDRLRAIFAPPSAERMLTPQQVWGSGGIWRPLTAAGVPVDVEQAMRAAQGACIRLLADDIASLPVDTYRKVQGRAQPTTPPDWVRSPSGNRWYTWPVFASELVVSLLSDGNDFVRCWPSTYQPQLFTVLDPDSVIIEAPGRYRVGGTQILTDMDIMHIPWVTLPGHGRGINVIDSAKDTTGLELAARQWTGAFFANGGAIGGLISVPGGPETVDADKLRDQWEARHTGQGNMWRPAVLTGGATFTSDTIAPKEADLDPLWRHVLEEAARLYHIPPHMLASQQPGGSSYSSVEQRSLEYIQHAIVPITVRLESALSQLLLGDDSYIKLNTNALLRGDMTSRAQFYSTMLDAKVIRREEVREKEDLPYDGDLGYLETPNNNAPSDAPAEPAPRMTLPDFVDARTAVDVHDAPVNVSSVFKVDDLQISEEVSERLADATSRGHELLAQAFADSGADVREAILALLAEVREGNADRTALLERLAAVEALINEPESVRMDGDDVYRQRGDRIIKQRRVRDANGRTIGLVAAS